jgi:hypothetical protein
MGSIQKGPPNANAPLHSAQFEETGGPRAGRNLTLGPFVSTRPKGWIWWDWQLTHWVKRQIAKDSAI